MKHIFLFLINILKTKNLLKINEIPQQYEKLILKIKDKPLLMYAKIPNNLKLISCLILTYKINGNDLWIIIDNFNKRLKLSTNRIKLTNRVL